MLTFCTLTVEGTHAWNFGESLGWSGQPRLVEFEANLLQWTGDSFSQWCVLRRGAGRDGLDALYDLTRRADYVVVPATYFSRKRDGHIQICSEVPHLLVRALGSCEGGDGRRIRLPVSKYDETMPRTSYPWAPTNDRLLTLDARTCTLRERLWALLMCKDPLTRRWTERRGKADLL